MSRTAAAQAAQAPRAEPARESRVAKSLRALRTLTLGGFACQILPLAFVALGWILRRTRRAVLESWWLQSNEDRRGDSFASFCEEDEQTRGLQHRPAWVFREGARGPSRLLPTAFWTNLKLGVQAWGNAWLLTLPAMTLWSFGWRLGWDDSFRKGYEQAAAGPLIGLLGTVFFVAAMLHLPLAQARQAVTGRWRDFWNLRLVAGLRRSRPVASAALALAWSATALPFLVLRVAPLFAGNAVDSPSGLSAEDAERLLGGYFLLTALVVLILFVLTRSLAGRLFALSLRTEVQAGRIAADELAPIERGTLDRLGLSERNEARPRPAVTRLLTWTGGKALGWTTGLLSCALWFTLAAQVFVAQFFLYLPLVGWWNHPLVQLPWYRYMPAGG